MSTEKQRITPTVKGPGDWFTGDVYFNAHYTGRAPSNARLNIVRFTPGAHTAWHRHGPTADDFMCHLALWEAPADRDEPETVWGEKVTAEQYPAGRERTK